MLLQNILASPFKIATCFTEPFYSMMFSAIKCEDDSLKNLVACYKYFLQRPQYCIKFNKISFSKTFSKDHVQLEKKFKLETISLVNGNDSKIIKEWNGPNYKEFIDSYNTEILNAIVSNLTKDGDKIQIKIKVDEKVKEFIFYEFKVTGEFVEFSNCRFSTQKACFLDYFPKNVCSGNYISYYFGFWHVMFANSFENSKVKNITEGENIKSSLIRTTFNSGLFFDMKEFKKPNEFKFTDFNLSMRQSEEFEEIEKTKEKEVSTKPLTLFFETTKKIPKISFDMFFSSINLQLKQKVSKKIAIEISKDEKITQKVEPISFSLVEMQQEGSILKVILGRPTGEVKNPIKAKDSVSIEFTDLNRDMKLTKITLNAEEEIEGDYTFTTFRVNIDLKKEKEFSLCVALTNVGLVSITLNGDNGIIGTYGLSAIPNVGVNYYYSDKLLSIPFKAKSWSFTTRVIILVLVVGTLFFVGIFAYFYTKKKEENLDKF